VAKHRVRTHSWIDGILVVKDHFFEALEHALGFAKDNGHSAKIFDGNGQVTHHFQQQPTAVKTYA
jgi:hypothetical protein